MEGNAYRYRLKRVAKYIEKEKAFCFTCGEGVADVDISAEIAFHSQHGKWATVAAIQPLGRYVALQLDGAQVSGFTEEPLGDMGKGRITIYSMYMKPLKSCGLI